MKIIHLILLVCTSAYPQYQELFDESTSKYNRGNYNAVIQIYDSILKSGFHSKELYFNMGNAYYKLNKVGASIYYYEKALQLSPHNKEVMVNLQYAENMKIDAIDKTPTLLFEKIMSIFLFWNYEYWGYASVCFVFLFVVTFLIYRYHLAPKKKRLYFSISMITILLSLSSYGLASYTYWIGQRSYAIIFTKESTVRGEPNLGSSPAFILHEGSKVRVLENFERWKKIQLQDGKIGWILQEDIKLL